MKTLLLTLFLTKAHAHKFSFEYKTPDELKINVEAENYSEALKKSAKLCFDILTKGTYQGENKSLDIIDVCVNPK